jgi:two-component system sensor histidine kinase MprB
VALRGRLTLMSALIVGVTLVLASVVAYAAVRNQQVGQVDDALRGNVAFYQRVAARFSGAPQPGRPEDTPPPNLGGPGAYVQLIRPNGETFVLGAGGLALPVTKKALATASGQSDGGFSDAHVDGVHLRVLTASLGPIGAVQAARSLSDADRVLDRLRVVLILLVIVGTALAAGVSRLFSRRAVTPVTELTEAAEHIEEIGNLVADLIELARDGESSPVREDVRLDDLVAEGVVRARRHAPRVSFTLRSEPSVVLGAPDRLGRAVNNLLDNAAQHSDRVEVTVSADGIVAVRDHGQGVPEGDIPYLFDRFYRGATARGRPGSGLGLAIVRQVAEAHGGSVRVESPEDGGARFVLALPGEPA